MTTDLARIIEFLAPRAILSPGQGRLGWRRMNTPSHFFARGPILRLGVPMAAAGVMAAGLTLAAGPFGLFTMPLMAGCGPGMLQASLGLALRMAAGMVVIGILTARPRLMLAAWVLGLTGFALADGQAAMAGLALTDARLGLLLSLTPLAVGLLVAALVPRGHRACVATMVVMAHAGLMTWPWMAGCAVLTAWAEGWRRRACGLRPSHRLPLSA
jgi:hypothetical protein